MNKKALLKGVCLVLVPPVGIILVINSKKKADEEKERLKSKELFEKTGISKFEYHKFEYSKFDPFKNNKNKDR